MPHKKWFIALLACLSYGGWALYSNWVAGSKVDILIAWRAAIIQGSYAGLLTAVSMITLERVYIWFESRRSIINAKTQALAAVTVAQYGIIVPVHWLNQTPNILMTLAPGLVIGVAFSGLYLSQFIPPGKP